MVLIQTLFYLDPIKDIIFTVLAVIFCFIIYFRTSEIFSLTKYPGIGYFRDGFFFMGLSYLIRLIFSMMFFSRLEFMPLPSREFILIFLFLPLGYFSTIGIFYLILSSIKKGKINFSIILLGHFLALILSVVSLISRSHFILLNLQTLLLIVALLLIFFIGEEKKISQIKVLYFLVAILWLINLRLIDSKRPFGEGFEIIIQLISLGVFIFIFQKLSRWVK